MHPLTRKQRAIYEFIAEEIRANGVAPTLQETCQRFHLRSISTVHKHLEALQAKGYIKRRWNHQRAIELLWTDGCCPTCGQPKPAVRAEVEAK